MGGNLVNACGFQIDPLPSCGKQFEKLVKERDRKHIRCPECKEKVRQKVVVLMNHYWEGGKPS